MIRNYFKIAIRNLQKQKIFAFINVVGLSLGVACFSLLILFAIDEFSFDKFHKNAANIYRPYEWDRLASPPTGYTDISGSSAASLGEAMKQNIPDVVNFARIRLPWGENLIRANNRVSRISLSFADPSFFSIFSFPLKYGNRTSALHNVNDLVLTVSRARQLFGTADVVGKTVELQIGTSFYPFTVTAVANDPPNNSTIQFDVLGNYQFASIHKSNFFIGNSWHPTVEQTYVLLKPGSTLPGNTARIATFMQSFDKNFVSNTQSYIKQMHASGINWKESGLPVSLRLQPLLAIHTDTAFNGWSFTDFGKIDSKIVWILLMIASGILLIACINFTTLAIGRSAGRSKEAGVRKVIGAERKQIIFQFLTEAMLLSVISTVVGFILAGALLPWFNELTGRHLHLSIQVYPQALTLLFGIMTIAGLLAGSYPAFVLSAFKPVEVLKNKIRIGGSNLFTRSLVTFQFVLSIILIISTIVILQQTDYMINKNPGFDKEHIVALDASEIGPGKVFPAFKQDLLSHTEIAGVTSAAAGLGAGQDFLGYTDNDLSAAVNIVDPDYIKVLGMQLLAGRNFDPAQANDTVKRVIINETMMQSMKWNVHNAVGQIIKHFQGQNAHVIGVVKNFNFRPMGEKIGNQLFLTSGNKGYEHFYARVKPGDLHGALAVIQNAWRNAAPDVPIKYTFLDENINHYYDNEQRWTHTVSWAGGISIFLASLGLLGLATLAAVNRTKEIGIRKALGASVENIVILLSKDFIKLILIAFVAAAPVAWYMMHRWLQNYSIRINVSWWVFVLTAAGAVAIAFITISSQAIKAAMAKPVKSLRSE
ncbi:MAG TPA: ABC transporter permease [Mucilaginibacter sp.]|nr:ABC transporter permease [Mucilaginibacter sp.]